MFCILNSFCILVPCCIFDPLFNAALPSPRFIIQATLLLCDFRFSLCTSSNLGRLKYFYADKLFHNSGFHKFLLFASNSLHKVFYKVCGRNWEQFTWKRVGSAFEIIVELRWTGKFEESIPFSNFSANILVFAKVYSQSGRCEFPKKNISKTTHLNFNRKCSENFKNFPTKPIRESFCYTRSAHKEDFLFVYTIRNRTWT